jgi:hypothetical protein
MYRKGFYIAPPLANFAKLDSNLDGVINAGGQFANDPAPEAEGRATTAAHPEG